MSKHIIQKFDKNNIITIGSCLSRFTAGHLSRAVGGRLTSAVYHNRSDLLSRYVETGVATLDGKMPELNINDKDFDTSYLIIMNQQSDTIGLHGMTKGMNLKDSLAAPVKKLILMDNYLDMTAKLAVDKNDEAFKFFFNSKYASNFNERYYLEEDYLNPTIAAENWFAILQRLLGTQTDAHIVFFNFPTTLYPESFGERSAVFHKHFVSLLRRSGLYKEKRFLYINSPEVGKAHKTHQKQHFKPTYYNFMAGCVASFTSTN